MIDSLQLVDIAALDDLLQAVTQLCFVVSAPPLQHVHVVRGRVLRLQHEQRHEFEDLTDMYECPDASLGQKCTLNRLSQYDSVEYKAAEYCLNVTYADPKNTSRQCSHCAYPLYVDNHESGSFKCQECASESHADSNTAKNINRRYLCRNQTGNDGGVRSNNGILSVTGAYEPPADNSVRTGVHVKSESHPLMSGYLRANTRCDLTRDSFRNFSSAHNPMRSSISTSETYPPQTAHSSTSSGPDPPSICRFPHSTHASNSASSIILYHTKQI